MRIKPGKWDKETDVLIIGAGTAGCPAAIAVQEAGYKATLLETTNITGGSGRLIMVGGAFYGTDVQKKAGLDDSPQQAYKDGIEVAMGDPDMWRLVADNNLDTYNWLKSIGCSPVQEEILALPGHTVPRLHRYVGGTVHDAIEKATMESGAEILFGHRAKRLIQDPETERVLGAVVQTKDGLINIKAKKAVILTTGGFVRNREMISEYNCRFEDCIPLSAPGTFGDGFLMATELGAKTSHMGDAVVASLAACTTTHADRALIATWKGAIMVNVNGERFTDESCPGGYYGDCTDAGLDQPGKVYWIIYDDDMRNAAGVEEMSRHKEFVADTFEELAKVSGISNPEKFVKTIEQYHRDLDSEGYDTVFGRKHLTYIHGTPVKLSKAPFYAVKCETSITSFKGGLKVNSRLQVQSVFGETIPGLYSAGEVNGGLFSHHRYLGGTNWTSAMSLGRVAGQNAVLEKPWA